MKPTRKIQIDVVAGPARVTRRVLGRTQHLDLAQVRIVISPTGITHAAFATDNYTTLVRVHTPEWVLDELDIIETALRRSPIVEIALRDGIRVRAALRSETYPLRRPRRIPFTDGTYLYPTRVEVAEPGRVGVIGDLFVHGQNTHREVTTTYDAHNVPTWIAQTLAVPSLTPQVR